MRYLSAPLLLSALIACSPSSVPSAPGEATAAISGDLVRQFIGVSSFTSSDGGEPGQPASVTVSARARGSDGEQEMVFDIIGTAHPVRGRYAIRPAGTLHTTETSVTAVYMETDSRFVAFSADSGTFTITYADAKRIDGTFHLVASRYCLRYEDGALEGSCDPSVRQSGTAPRIALQGSITAKRSVTMGGY
jgi:hypothetical protein